MSSACEKGIKPNASRTEKFITSLELAEKEDFCEKKRLIELQNNGSLSARKRSAHFDFLTDEELSDMEQAVRDGYNRPEKAIDLQGEE